MVNEFLNVPRQNVPVAVEVIATVLSGAVALTMHRWDFVASSETSKIVLLSLIVVAPGVLLGWGTFRLATWWTVLRDERLAKLRVRFLSANVLVGRRLDTEIRDEENAAIDRLRKARQIEQEQLWGKTLDVAQFMLADTLRRPALEMLNRSPPTHPDFAQFWQDRMLRHQLRALRRAAVATTIGALVVAVVGTWSPAAGMPQLVGAISFAAWFCATSAVVVNLFRHPTAAGKQAVDEEFRELEKELDKHRV